MNEARRLPPLTAVAGLVATLGLSACIGPPAHYYAEAGHVAATYSEVHAAQQPETLRLDLHFVQNGADNAAAAKLAREDVLHVLDEVGGFTISDDPQAETLSVTIRGTYDPLDRSGEYVVALDILSMQWFPHPLVDPLHFEFVLRPANGSATRIARFDHAVLATVASHGREPDDHGPFDSPAGALNATIEDVTLHFLKDLQGSTQTAAPLVYLP